jgi:SARP family transcriptional regulator, regulator of embCAB operon
VTRTGGYTFRADGAELDLREFETQVAGGRAALAEGNDARAVRHLGAALALWRGPALADVPVGRMLEATARELEEMRLVTLERLIDAELKLGRHREVVAKLAGLTVQNPLHEGLHRQYMLALHLTGRRAQALEVFHHLRRTLAEELGLEPAPHLHQLQLAILNCDPDVEISVRDGARPGPTRADLAAAARRTGPAGP